METLTPVQRVAVIAIGLALTLLVAMLLLPWVWKQISEWLPAMEPGSLGSLIEFTAPAAFARLNARPLVTLSLLAVLPCGF